MVAALAKNLAAAGHRVGVVTPLYRPLWGKHAPRRMDWWMDLPIGARRVQPEVWTLEPHPNLTVETLCPTPPPTSTGTASTAMRTRRIGTTEEPARRLLQGRRPSRPSSALEAGGRARARLANRAGAPPDPDGALREGWNEAPRTVCTIHNLAYQGVYPRETWMLTNLPDNYFHPGGAEFHRSFNLLKTGLVFADAITTVSPRYAREITTAEFGEGLDGCDPQPSGGPPRHPQRRRLRRVADGRGTPTCRSPYRSTTFPARPM